MGMEVGGEQWERFFLVHMRSIADLHLYLNKVVQYF